MRTKVELPLGWNQGRRYKATVSMVSPAEMLSQGKLLLARYRLLRIRVRALKCSSWLSAQAQLFSSNWAGRRRQLRQPQDVD